MQQAGLEDLFSFSFSFSHILCSTFVAQHNYLSYTFLIIEVLHIVPLSSLSHLESFFFCSAFPGGLPVHLACYHRFILATSAPGRCHYPRLPLTTHTSSQAFGRGSQSSRRGRVGGRVQVQAAAQFLPVSAGSWDF